MASQKYLYGLWIGLPLILLKNIIPYINYKALIKDLRFM